MPAFHKLVMCPCGQRGPEWSVSFLQNVREASADLRSRTENSKQLLVSLTLKVAEATRLGQPISRNIVWQINVKINKQSEYCMKVVAEIHHKSTYLSPLELHLPCEYSQSILLPLPRFLENRSIRTTLVDNYEGVSHLYDFPRVLRSLWGGL